MGKLEDFLSGVKVLEEVNSPINGKIQVVRSLGLGTYIQVEGLTQSGGVVRDVWRTVLKKLSHQSLTINNCLILGLGAGSAAKLVRKYWPVAKITGVEIDPIMVKIGKKYLSLDKVGVDIVIEDAEKFLLDINHQPLAINYDLILVDLYIGYNVPEKFTTKDFILRVKNFLAEDRIAVFNRLYFGDKRKEVEKLGQILEEIFSKVERVYPEANVMFVCER